MGKTSPLFSMWAAGLSCLCCAAAVCGQGPNQGNINRAGGDWHERRAVVWVEPEESTAEPFDRPEAPPVAEPVWTVENKPGEPFEGGCACCAPRVGHPAFSSSVPLGSSVFHHFQTQVDNGTASRLVMYRFDFYNIPGRDPSQLNPYGVRRLQKLSRIMRFSQADLIVENSLDRPGLAQARRSRVLEKLAELGIPVPPHRVVVAAPPSRGLSGAEALEIEGNLIRQTRDGPQGWSGSQGGGSATGMSASGIEPGGG